jgi:F-type H+-transporting ATPase subunit epsilon
MRIYVRGGFADVTPAGLTILAEEARNLTDAKAEDVDAEIEAARLKLLALDAADTKQFALQEQIAYLEGIRAALAN